MRFIIGSVAATILLAVVAVSMWQEPKADARTQDSTRPGLTDNKDYRHSWIDVEGVKAHYIEAGQGDPFVLVHGALAW